MIKCDVTLTKSFTIQPESFNSIHPTISLTLKDKSLESIDIKTMAEFINLLDSLFQLQISADIFQYREITSRGLDEYYKQTVNELAEIKETIKKAIEKLNENTIKETF